MPTHLLQRGRGASVIPVAGVRAGNQRNRGRAEPLAEPDPVPLWLVIPIAAAVSLLGWILMVSAVLGLGRALHYF